MRTGGQEKAGEGSERFFGRPVLFRCRVCDRVKVAGPHGAAQEPWQDESAVLQAQGLSPDGAWWFHTRCESCQSMGRKSQAV